MPTDYVRYARSRDSHVVHQIHPRRYDFATLCGRTMGRSWWGPVVLTPFAPLEMGGARFATLAEVRADAKFGPHAVLCATCERLRDEPASSGVCVMGPRVRRAS
jgi:hypothetical protein